MRAPCGVLPGRGCRCVRTAGFGVPVSAGARKLWTFRLWRCLVADPAEDAARRAYGPEWGFGFSDLLLAATLAGREVLTPIRALHRKRTDGGESYCVECCHIYGGGTDLTYHPWPCPTARLVYSTTELEEGSTS